MANVMPHDLAAIGSGLVGTDIFIVEQDPSGLQLVRKATLRELMVGMGLVPKTLTTQMDVSTAVTTLADISGLSVDLVAGKTYRVRAQLTITLGSSGGVTNAFVQVKWAGTATFTTIRMKRMVHNNALSTYNVAPATMTSFGSSIVAGFGGGAGAGGTVIYEFDGIVVVNAAGTLKLQFATDSSNNTTATHSVLVGSWLQVIGEF